MIILEHLAIVLWHHQMLLRCIRWILTGSRDVWWELAFSSDSKSQTIELLAELRNGKNRNICLPNLHFPDDLPVDWSFWPTASEFPMISMISPDIYRESPDPVPWIELFDWFEISNRKTDYEHWTMMQTPFLLIQ